LTKIFYKFFNLIRLYYQTAKYLKKDQFLYRFKKIFTRKIYPKLYTQKRRNLINDPKEFIKKKNIIEGKKFSFAGIKENILTNPKWIDDKKPNLWIYNLNYFDFLNSESGNEDNLTFDKVLEDWISKNKDIKQLSWDPYPISLRIVNWIKWIIVQKKYNNTFEDSLILQTEYLYKNIEFHLGGNHLFSNSKALIISGLFFQGKRSKIWYEKGMDIFLKEIDKQFLDDGGHFELSPMYHAILLEDVLDIINFHLVFKKKSFNKLEEKVLKMLNWLEIMTHPDGEISFFNDCSEGIASCYEELNSYANKLGFRSSFSKEKINILENTGYTNISSDNFNLILDRASIGPDFLPAHGHADCLTFELSLFGRRFIVNPGISTYQDNLDRHYERSTQSHSCLSINDENSSEVWSSFRVAKRAKVYDIKNSFNDDVMCLSASHDGFNEKSKINLYSRTWKVYKDKMEIIDKIEGNGLRDISIYFPLSPDVEIFRKEEKEIFFKFFEKDIFFKFSSSDNSKFSLTCDPHYYCKKIGEKINTSKIKISGTVKIPIEISTEFIWEKK